MDTFIPNKIKTTILKIKRMYALLLNKYNNLFQPKYHVQKVEVLRWISGQRLRASVLFLPLHVFLLQVTYKNESMFRLGNEIYYLHHSYIL